MFALLVSWLAWRFPKKAGRSVEPEVWLERNRMTIAMLHIANHGRDALHVGNVVLTHKGKPLRVEPEIRDGPIVVTKSAPARVYLGSSTDVLHAARQRELVCELFSPGGKLVWRGRVPDRTS